MYNSGGGEFFGGFIHDSERFYECLGRVWNVEPTIILRVPEQKTTHDTEPNKKKAVNPFMLLRSSMKQCFRNKIVNFSIVATYILKVI